MRETIHRVLTTRNAKRVKIRWYVSAGSSVIPRAVAAIATAVDMEVNGVQDKHCRISHCVNGSRQDRVEHAQPSNCVAHAQRCALGCFWRRVLCCACSSACPSPFTSEDMLQQRGAGPTRGARSSGGEDGAREEAEADQRTQKLVFAQPSVSSMRISLVDANQSRRCESVSFGHSRLSTPERLCATASLVYFHYDIAR